MTDEPQQREQATNRIDPDLCIACGYDLRGTPTDANCPECGAAAADSVPDFPIGAEGPAAARSINTGTAVLMVSVGLWILSIVGSLFFGPLSIVLVIAAVAGTIIGCFRLTAGFGNAPRPRAALVVHAGTIGLGVVTLAVVGLPTLVWFSPWIALAVLGCNIVAAATTCIALGHCGMALAARVPSYRAIRAARRYRRWAVILSIASAVAPFLLWGIFKIMEANSPPQTGWDGLGLFLGAVMLTGLPILIIAITTAVMFFIAMTSLRRALKPLLA